MTLDSIARSQVEALRVRVEELERSLRQVYDHLGLEAPTMTASSGDEIAPEILALLHQGNTIQAITTYRDHTGADLASAKAAVERLKAEHGIR